MKHIAIKLFSKLYIAAVMLVLAVESLSVSLTFIPDGRMLLAGLIILLFILRYKDKMIFKPKIELINQLALAFLTVITLVFLLLERQLGFQYVYSRFGLSYSRLVYLTFATAFLGLYFISFNLSKKVLKKIIFILPIFLIIGGLLVYLRNNQFFRILVKDDHVVEYTQLFLLLGCVWCSYKLFIYWRQREKILAVPFLLAAFLCFFVAGEEISWGQRLFNLETPETVAEKNLQDEITVHNIDVLFGWVYRGYMAIGFIGSTAWAAFKLIKKKLSQKTKKIFSNLIPDWYLTLYFAVAFFYNWDRFFLRPHTGEALWEEPMELLLIIGITIFFVTKYIRVYPQKIKTIKSWFLDNIFNKK